MKLLPWIAGIAFFSVVAITGKTWMLAVPMFGVGAFAAGVAWLLAH